MKAVVVIPGRPESAHLRDVPLPEINDDEVLVRSIRAGICGTDREIHQGLYGSAEPGKEYLVLGHESSGVVVSVGKNVLDISPGQYVVRAVRRPCPGCANCAAGANDLCVSGNFRESGIKEIDGCMAEYFKDYPQYLIPLPVKLAEVSVLLEPLSVVEKAWRQAQEIQRRLSWEPKTALVVGAGPIGLLQTLILVEEGLDVAVLARSPAGNLKSQLVTTLGARYFSTSTTSEEDIFRDLGPRDFIVEASGDATKGFEMMRYVGNNGVLCLTSITGGNTKAIIPAEKINLDYVLGNKVLFGTVNAHLQDYQRGVQRLEAALARCPDVLSQMFTRRIPLIEYTQALQPVREDIKVTLEISQR